MQKWEAWGSKIIEKPLVLIEFREIMPLGKKLKNYAKINANILHKSSKIRFFW